MNAVTLLSTGPTMTSREIADLTQKQHGHVKRDIEKMLADLGEDVSTFGCIYFDGANREQTEYALDRELTDVLLSGYSAPLRRKVIQRWRELEAKVADDPLANLPPEQRALVSVMLDNVQIKQEQARQAESLVQIERRMDETAQTQLMQTRPANAESIVHIRERMNKKYGLPARVVDIVMRQSIYAPKPAGMVKNAREEAQGASYAVYWIKDVSKVFDIFVNQCKHETATQAVHPLIDGRFKLTPAEKPPVSPTNGWNF